ncbi:MAG: ComEA family DNA-binding protein, partial [Planctomycetota bacterium]
YRGIWQPHWPISINTASEAALACVPGIGDSTAMRIVRDREVNGPFDSVAQLSRVKGIGQRLIDGWSGYLSL